MNNIYKVIWSKAKNCYVVASEIAKSHTKSASGSEKMGGYGKKALLALAAASAIFCGGLVNVGATVHVNEGTGVTSEVYTTGETYNKTEVDNALTAKGAATDVATNKADIANLKTAVGDAGSGLTKAVADQKADIATNRANINNLDGKLANLTTTVNGKADEADVNNKLAQKANQTAVTALDGRVGSLETTVGDASSGLVKDVADLKTQGNDLNTAIGNKADQSDLDAAKAKITTNETNITALQTKTTGLSADGKSLNSMNRVETDALKVTGAISDGAGVTTTLVDIKASMTQTETNKGDIADLKSKTDTQQTWIGRLKDGTTQISYDAAKGTTVNGVEFKDAEVDANGKGLTGVTTLNTTGAATIGGALKADSLIVENASHLKGDVTMDKTLSVTGDTSLKKTDVDGALNAKDNVILGTNAANTVTVNGKSDFKAAVEMDKGLTVTSGDTTLKGTKVDGKLTVTDETDLKKTKVDGTLTTTGKATFQEAVEMDKGLTVTSGDTTLQNTDVKGALNVTGESSLKDTQVNGTLTTTGKATFKEAVDMDKGLTVTSGDTTLQNTDVKGALNVTGESNLKNTTVGGTLGVTGEATFKDKVTMDKTLSVTGDTTLKGTKVDGKLTVTDEADLKNTTVGGTLGVTGEATFKDKVTMEKDLEVKGELKTDKIAMENKKTDADGRHNSSTAITADYITHIGEVENSGVITKSSFTHNEKGTINYAKDGDTADWKETRSYVTASGVSNKMTDSDKNKHTYSQTATESKEQLVNGDKSKSNFEKKTAEGNTISITEKDAAGNVVQSLTNKQTVKGEKTSVTNEDSSSIIKQEADQIRHNVTSADGKKSSIEVKAEGITNKSKDGTITNDAKNIVNNASGDMTNTVGGKLTTTVTGATEENYNGGLTTNVTGEENHTVTGKQNNKVTGKQTNTVEGGQINNITGDQTTTITGTKTETVTENVTEDYQKNLTTTVGGNEIHDVKGTKTETVEGKVTENFKGGQETNVTGNQDIHVTGKQTNKIDGNQENTIGGDQTTNVTGDILNTAKNITNAATETLTDKVGTNTRVINSTSITDTVGTANRKIEDGKITDTAGDSTVTTKDGEGTTFAKTTSAAYSTGTGAPTDTNIAGNLITTGRVDANELGVSDEDGANTADFSVKAGEGVKASAGNGTTTGSLDVKADEVSSSVKDASGKGSTFKQRIDKIMMESKDVSIKAEETLTNEAKVITNKASEVINNEAVNINNTATGIITSKASEIKNQADKLISNKVGENTWENMENGKITTSIKDGAKQNLTQSNAAGTTQSTVDGAKLTVTIQNADGLAGAVTDGTNTSVQNQTASAIATDVKDGAGNENASVANATTSANTITNGTKANTVISTADGTSFINSEAAAPVTGDSGAGTAVNTTIKGNTITTGKVTMDYAEVMKDLGVHGNAKVDQNLEVGGTSTLKGDVTMESNATVKKDLKVEGTTTTKTLKVTENAEIDGTLKVAKKATFEDSVSIAKDLSVGGDVTANSYKVGDKTYISAAGINANDQKITNVADGSISEGSKDAVNGGQLYGVKRDLEHQVDKVGANAAAMANLRPMEFDPSSKWNIAAAIGNYGSETAAALGAFYRPNDNVMVNLSTAFGTGENMVGGGVSVRLGKSGNKLSREENNALKAQVDDLTARMDALLSVLNPNMSKDFPDVPENHWAYEAVSRLAGNDIVQGYPDGEFHGERTMTRYEMAEIIYNALSRGAEAERELVEEFKPELQAMAASEKATAEKAEG